MTRANDSGCAESPSLVATIPALRAAFREYRAQGGRIGLVPTMGALHEGHLSLVRAARRDCDRIMVTIFVNPSQFNAREDLAKYPRTLSADLDLLARENVDLVFAPADDEIYPAGFSTFVEPPAVARTLEGVHRPGHFRGVATVVLKLFQLIPADMAFFGQKDYQQCLVIRRMVEDFHVPIEIRMCPVVRELDGLAMSSRNRHLTPSERQRASAIFRALSAGRQLLEQGQRSAAVLRDRMRGILVEAGIQRVDYVSVADRESLVELDVVADRAVLLIAAFVGETRLIDNVLIG
jgi:pantoate--beta-alanine ligase